MVDTHKMHNLEIPDEAKDMHTRAGRQMGRGIDHFFEEGAKLSPHEEQEGEEELREVIRKWYSNISHNDRIAEYETAKELPKNHPDVVANSKAKGDSRQIEMFDESEYVPKTLPSSSEEKQKRRVRSSRRARTRS